MPSPKLISKELFFELPQSSIRGIPVYSSRGEKISFGFVEVGCKPTRKRHQLRNKKQLFYKYWGDKYRRKLEWIPEVYRTLAHYDPTREPELGNWRYGVDTILFYHYITPAMLGQMNNSDKEQIYRVVSRSNKRRDILEEIIETENSDKLHQMIVDGGNVPQFANLRGKMAEILALKDLERTLLTGMNLYRNGDIRYFNNRYKNGTEIDGILTFYGEEKYIGLINNLHKLDHLEVKDRWH